MGTYASCGMEGYPRLRAPCIAQDRRCNEYGSVGHLARACTTKMTWLALEKGNRTRRKGKTPANRGGLPGGAGVHAQEPSCVQRELRSRHNLVVCKGWTGKRQKTHHVGSSKDKLTVGSSTVCTHPKADYTPSKDPRASSTEQGRTTVAVPQQGHIFYRELEDPGKMRHSKATLKTSQDCDDDKEFRPRGVRRDFPSADQSRGRGQNYEPVVPGVVQRWETDTRPGTTQAREFDTEIRNTRRPRLFDDRSRFQNIKDRPMLFPTNPVWFRRGSYADPLAGDVRRLAPLVE
jgi:hypothetical protein